MYGRPNGDWCCVGAVVVVAWTFLCSDGGSVVDCYGGSGGGGGVCLWWCGDFYMVVVVVMGCGSGGVGGFTGDGMVVV